MSSLLHDYQEFCRYGVLSPTVKIGKAVEEATGMVGGQAVVNAMGLIGEVGEVVDIIKKHFGHGKPLDEEHLVEELGDVLWYVNQIANNFGLDIKTIIRYNINKLNRRYPNEYAQQFNQPESLSTAGKRND